MPQRGLERTAPCRRRLPKSALKMEGKSDLAKDLTFGEFEGPKGPHWTLKASQNAKKGFQMPLRTHLQKNFEKCFKKARLPSPLDT